MGGKSLMAKRLIEMFPEHTCYVEVFGGAGWTLFKKPYPNRGKYREVYNDINGELVNMFRVLRDNPDGFCREMDLVLIARETFETFLDTDPEQLDEVRRAVRFFYLVKASFAGLQRSFGIHTQTGALKPNLRTIRKTAQDVRRRLENVLVEKMDYKNLIEIYDRDYTLFFLDPPYWRRKCYDFNFEDRDFEELRDAVAGIKGKFLLTLDASNFIKDLFKGFHQVETTTRYSCSREPNTRGVGRAELIICNFDPGKETKWLKNN
jgi:DNA adenine methylase